MASGESFPSLTVKWADLAVEVTQTIADGDYVVMKWTATGTHDGSITTLVGDTLPPTGRKASISGSSTMEFKNGKIVRSTVYFDVMTLMAQLGLRPGA